MPIILIEDDEEFPLAIDDSTLWYRRIPSGKRAEIIQKHTLFGELNNMAAQVEMAEYALTRWDNVRDRNGKNIPYKLEYVAAGLPTSVLMRIMEKVNESAPEHVLKNLNGQLSDDLSLKE